MTLPLTEYTKDPGATLDYKVDWTDWLGDSETISSATVTVPAGITLDTQTNTTTAQTAWLSGGTAGVSYDVVYQVTTNQSRTDQRTIRVNVEDR